MSKKVNLQSIMEFVWTEADMLDHNDYQSWLSLWTESGKYIIPIDPDTDDYANNLNFAYDNAAMRDMRVRRLTSGQSMSAAHAAKTVRTLSRFRRLEDDAQGNSRIRCAQNLVEYKFDKHRIYAANVTYTLTPEGETFKLAEKVVLLVNSTDALTGITYLL